ncbi:glycosyl hydrolase family 5 [Salipiger pacificus]|nr:glycosyl hydrolase family 5 [Alloyangia pacifica]MCA0943310.1 glycosyl hydrolase family 5 [Alloyangia pacifica]
MNRRELLASLCATSLSGALSLPAAALAATSGTGLEDSLRDVWEAWRDANMDATGRVIDRLQKSSSHSEGQAYGMLLAAMMGDRAAFERMDAWTRLNLAIRQDSLMAWRWLPDAPVRVPDLNNASDGDLFRAWALLRAAQRFEAPEYRAAAEAIVRDLAKSCIVHRPGADPLLLPAARGFETEAGFLYNPCYTMPLAMHELATEFNQPVLAAAARGAVELARQLALEGVVPDWVEVTPQAVGPAKGFSFDAGYEAMRVPLYFVWSGLRDHPAVLRFAEAQSRVPPGLAATRISRGTGEALSTSTEPGYKAIAALATCSARQEVGARIPPFSPGAPYYPATLQLFALLAQAEALPACVPL